MVHVTIQVTSCVVNILHRRGTATTESKELLRKMDGLGRSLEPLHPGTDDQLLSQFFIVEVPNRATAELVITSLQNCKAVQSAYLKPPDEMPR